MTTIRTLACALIAVAALSACGPATRPAGAGAAPPPTTRPTDGEADGGTGGPAATSAPPPASPTPQVQENTAVLPDGDSPVFINKVDVSGHTLTFDLLELYFGADAEKEWKKDNPGQEPQGLDGVYVRNNNPKLRTVPVSSTVVVKMLRSELPDDYRTITLAQLPDDPMFNTVFWLTVKNGVVVQIREQFFS